MEVQVYPIQEFCFKQVIYMTYVNNELWCYPMTYLMLYDDEFINCMIISLECLKMPMLSLYITCKNLCDII